MRDVMFRALAPAALFMIVSSLLLWAPDVSGDAQVLSVVGGGTRSIALGFLYTGSTAQYSWITGSELELVDFYVEDSAGRRYQELTETFQGANTFVVPTDGSYLLTWDCKKYPAGAQVSYTYKVTAVTIEADLTVDLSWDNNRCPQGQSSVLDVMITNPNDGQIKLGMVGLHMDWDDRGEYLKNRTVDVQVVTIQSKGQLSVTIGLQVADDAALGLHSYLVNVTYDLLASNNWHTFHWNSGNMTDFYVLPKDTDKDGTPDVEDDFPEDPSEQKDSDGDGAGDRTDAFPSDPAASKDTDKDGYPDAWNFGYTEKNSTTGLKVDAFPIDPAASNDTDGDGYPNEWNDNRTQVDSTSGLVLDKYPDDPYRWKVVEVDHTKTYIIIAIAVVGVVMLMVIMALVIVRIRKGTEKASKESELEAERVRKEMEEHQKFRELEKSGGTGVASASNVSVLSPEGGVVSSVPTTLEEAHALDGQTKKPITYEDLYGKKEDTVEASGKDSEASEGQAGRVVEE